APTGSGRAPVARVHEVGAVTPPDGPADAGTVLLAGDSVAWSLLAGFDRWTESHPDHTLQIDSLTSFGCPIGGRGRYRTVHERYTLPDCAAFADTVTTDLADHPPDAIVFVMGLGNLNGREIDGVWRDLGDPVHDRWLEDRVDDLATRLEEAGVPVLWLTFPYVRLADPEDPTRPWQEIPLNDPARVDRYNALVNRVLAGHDGVEVVDLAGWVATWPNGSFDPADRDGVHFSFRASARVVEWLAPTILMHLGVEPPPP
ncbi:MAG TPA: SGNH hydrolase domain-containing protein, partial [Acidimicrobiales bacterium]|nr:SGNH hydrolase domain-containing protein [Acidimicrobiales bacterium]